MAAVGGKTLIKQVHRTWAEVVTDKLATALSWAGKSGKIIVHNSVLFDLVYGNLLRLVLSHYKIFKFSLLLQILLLRHPATEMLINRKWKQSLRIG